MGSFFLRWVVSAVALYVTVMIGQALGLHISIDKGVWGVVSALVAAALLGVVNAVIRPIVSLFALPITCLTLGLFSFVINALLFWLVGSVLHSFHVANFVAALFGSIVMSIVGSLLNLFVVSPVTKAREKKSGQEA